MGRFSWRPFGGGRRTALLAEECGQGVGLAHTHEFARNLFFACAVAKAWAWQALPQNTPGEKHK